MLALLLHSLTGNEVWDAAVRRGDDQRRVAVAARGLDIRIGGLLAPQPEVLPASDAKVVPMRFPPKLYEELKGWCEAHNFPMAAVVRGLVERFLESQGRPSRY